MITSGGITLDSNYTARVLRDTPILKDATTPLGASAKTGYVYPYVGIPEGNNGLRAVVVQTAIPFADKGVRPCVLYLATADVVIEVVPPVAPPPAPADTTPFSQADIDAAVADYKVKLDAANAATVAAAAETSAAQAALAPWQEYKAAHDKVGL